MGTWKKHIENLRAEFIGKRIEYEGKPYTVAAVDYNGIIHIDKASAHNPTTAVYKDYESRKHLIQPEPVAELAKRVYNLDVYEMRNNGTTPEDIAESIRTDPNETIKYLLDIIDELQA